MSIVQHYTVCQFVGPFGGRVIGGPWEFDVTTVSYALGAPGWMVRFYHKNDKTQQVGELSSDMQNHYVSELRFNLVESGCGDFDIVLLVDPANLPFTVEYNQGVEIYLYHDINPWYSGYILGLPTTGSTKRPWLISGTGYSNQLETCIIDQDYTSEEVSEIIHDLVSSYIEDKTDIVYAAHKIAKTEYTVNDIRFDYTSAKDAVHQLMDLARAFVFGVDEEREFFFLPIDYLVNPAAEFTVGKHVTGFELTEDTNDLANRIHVRAGLLSGAPKTNIQATVSDYSSQVAYGLREKVLTAPSVRNATDAERWGGWKLTENRSPRQTATIEWVDCSEGKVEAKGKARILDRHGHEHKLNILRAGYTVGSSGIVCRLELGKRPDTMGRVIRDLLFELANQELLQSQNVGQL